MSARILGQIGFDTEITNMRMLLVAIALLALAASHAAELELTADELAAIAAEVEPGPAGPAGPPGEDGTVIEYLVDDICLIEVDGVERVFHCPLFEPEPVPDPDPPAPDPDPPAPDPDPEPDPPPPSGDIPDVPFDYLASPGPVTRTETLPSIALAGDVIQLLDTSTNGATIACSGTDDNPAYLIGGTITGSGNGSVINISGAHCHFIGTTFVNAQPRTSGSRHVLSGIEVSGNGKNCANIGGSEIVVVHSELHHCRPTSRDAHGIQITLGSRDIWLLNNKMHNNSGNGFQATHCGNGVLTCDNRPSGIYAYGNEIYENREGDGLKWADNVIIEGNTYHDLRASRKGEQFCFSDGFCGTWQSGSDGSAIVIGADNEPEGLTNVVIRNNLIYNTSQGLRVEDAVAPVIEGNTIRSNGTCLALDKSGHGIVFRNNVCEGPGRGIFQNWRVNFSLTVDDNVFDVGGIDVEYEERPVWEASTLTNNEFRNGATVIYGNTTATTADAINALTGASGNTVN